MEKICKAKDSGKVFYVQYEDEQDAILFNPLDRTEKTIKIGTFKRKYKMLEEEEISEAVEGFKEALNIDSEMPKYIPFFDCEKKEDFIETLKKRNLVSLVEIPETDLKKQLINAQTCFRENISRFKMAKDSYLNLSSELKKYPEDLNLLKALKVEDAALQRYVEKMALYYSKIVAVSDKL